MRIKYLLDQIDYELSEQSVYERFEYYVTSYGGIREDKMPDYGWKVVVYPDGADWAFAVYPIVDGKVNKTLELSGHSDDLLGEEVSEE